MKTLFIAIRSVIVMIIFLLFSKNIVSLFTDKANVINEASQCLTIVSIGYIFFSYGMIIAQSFNGAGDTRTPTILNFFAFWCIQIPLAYLLAITFSFGPAGLFSSIVISEVLLTIAGIIIFKKGKWKEIKI